MSFTSLKTVGASTGNREENDFYATNPKALELLLDEMQLSKDVWECACGKGHLSKVLEDRGYNVKSTDLIDRGYGKGGVDFLEADEKWDGDILSNSPFKYAKKFVEKALDLVPDGHKVIMFLKIQFLEGQKRREFFEKYPPKYIYVSSSRITCAINGEFDKYSNGTAVCYAWFIWEKGYKGDPRVRWFN